MNQINTDVLVIGAGLAGLSAAIEAKRLGGKVLLVGKRRAGRSGNSLLAACNMTGFEDNDEEQILGLIQDTLRGGGDIGDPVLVETLARNASAAIQFLENVGVKFLREEQGVLRRQAPGHGMPRTVSVEPLYGPVQTAGLALTLPLLKAVQNEQITLLEQHPIVQLLVADGRVYGAIALTPTGEPLTILAGAVVLACGGGGRLFDHSNNANDVTGDGLALAFEAGCTLRDLEFVQFHPTMGIHPVRAIFPNTLFADGAILRNRYGERFLLHHGGTEKDTTRDQMSRAIWEEIAAGRDVNGGVYLDLSAISSSTMRSRYPLLCFVLQQNGVQPEVDWPVVGLTVHFFMGGVQINYRAATGLSGLYACGEVTGGVHGANRLAGNALLDAVVFGRLAGRSAVEDLSDRPTGQTISRQFGPLSTGKEQLLEKIRETLKGLLWQHCGVVRSGESLQNGLAELKKLDRQFLHCGVEESPARWYELRGMLISARLLLTAALLREESRGAHYREDFPYGDDLQWQGSIILQRGTELNDVEHNFVPVVIP